MLLCYSKHCRSQSGCVSRKPACSVKLASDVVQSLMIPLLILQDLHVSLVEYDFKQYGSLAWNMRCCTSADIFTWFHPCNASIMNSWLPCIELIVVTGGFDCPTNVLQSCNGKCACRVLSHQCSFYWMSKIRRTSSGQLISCDRVDKNRDCSSMQPRLIGISFSDDSSGTQSFSAGRQWAIQAALIWIDPLTDNP